MAGSIGKFVRIVHAYASEMPITSAIRYIFDTLRLIVTLPLFSLPTRTLHFYPDWPLPAYFLWSVCSAGRIRIKPGVGKVTMLFNDTDLMDARELPKEHTRWINGRCLDIRKSTVARIYENVFERPLLIDPETHHGAAVRKSDTNGAHDGYIVECPTAREEGYAYEKLIDNSLKGESLVEDVRVIVVGRELPVAIVKHSSLSRRFSALPVRAHVIDPTSRFNADEIAGMLTFSHELGLDFGELDVLRDRTNGHIYIVDANPTALAHPVSLPFNERLKVIRQVATSFNRQFFEGRKAGYAKPILKKVGSVQ